MTASSDASSRPPVIEARQLGKSFGPVMALSGVSLAVSGGQVLCLLGDNGAGKSTLIKILSGVHRPTSGQLLMESRPVSFASPREALAAGIATVFQDLAMVPLMSVTRNFYLGREPLKRIGPLKFIDFAVARETAREEMRKIGISIRDADQPVGTLSGGERQCVAIARAVYFGAKVLILDEPTSALGVAQTAVVLQSIRNVRQQGLAVIFITHNVRHAYAVGDLFTVLQHGETLGTYAKSEISMEELQNKMAGGREIELV